MPEPGYFDLTFPLAGQDVMAQVGGQPPGTTALGHNVRALDPRTRRLRGGSRSGLTKYIDATPGGLTTEIQHLAVVVTHGIDGLSISGDDYIESVEYPPPDFDPGEERPRPVWEDPPPGSPTPPDVPPVEDCGDGYPCDWEAWPDPTDERFPFGPPDVPPGGGGTQPNPNVPPEGGDSTVGWQFVQRKFIVVQGTIGATPISGDVTLSGTLDNQLLLVAVYYFSDFDLSGVYEPDISVSGGGLTWTVLDRAQYHYSPNFFDINLKVYWAHNTTAGNITVTVTSTPTGAADQTIKFGMQMVEYRGLLNTSPFEGQANANGNPAPGPPHTITAGPTQQNGNDRLSLMFFSTIEVFSPITDPPTPSDGYTLRVNINQSEDGSGQVLSQRAYLIDDVSTPSGATVSPAVVCNWNPAAWCVVSATFRYS